MATGQGRGHVYDFRTKREPVFGVSVGGSFVGHRCRSVDVSGLTPTGKFFPDDSSVPYVHDRNQAVIGSQRGGSFTTEEHMEGLPTALDAAASFSSPNNSIVETFKQAFGGSIGAAGSAIVAGGGTTSTTQLDLTAGQGTRFVPGSVGFATTTSGPGGSAQLELFVVRKVVGDVLHLMWALASAPAALSAVINAETCYLDPDGVGRDTYSVYGELLGESADDQWKIRGACPVIDIIGDIDEFLTAQCTYQAATAAGPTAHGLTRGETVPTGGGRKAINQRIVYFGNVTDADSAATRNVHKGRSAFIHPGLALEAEQGDGIEGVYSFMQDQANPTVDLALTCFRDSTSYKAHFTEAAAYQAKYVAIQWGTSVAASGRGGIVAAVIPRATYMEPPSRSVGGKFVEVGAKLQGTRPLCYTGGTTAVVRSPILVAFA